MQPDPVIPDIMVASILTGIRIHARIHVLVVCTDARRFLKLVRNWTEGRTDRQTDMHVRSICVLYVFCICYIDEQYVCNIRW